MYKTSKKFTRNLGVVTSDRGGLKQGGQTFLKYKGDKTEHKSRG